MRLRSLSRSVLLLAMLVPLSSCAPRVWQRQQIFHEEDFRRSLGSGSGSVVGRADVVMRDHSQHVVANSTVDLAPVTPYTTEAIEVLFARQDRLTPGDPRFDQYMRTVPTDGDGYFQFRHLPAGEYYVGTSASWSRWFWNEDQKVTMIDTVPLYARVTVRDGQTTKVSEWLYGRRRSK